MGWGGGEVMCKLSVTDNRVFKVTVPIYLKR